MQNLELLPFLPLSTTFISIPALSSVGCMNGRTERGWEKGRTYTHERTQTSYSINIIIDKNVTLRFLLVSQM